MQFIILRIQLVHGRFISAILVENLVAVNAPIKAGLAMNLQAVVCFLF